ncbi:MAG: pyridoxal phosphate-dependent aminotransferase [Candidatus Krumholzibacteriota bacterium]|nr:pyridoxal phosphate-dependent aminotransferase [Candidatus Krumholzibacteriota bacterium]
MKRYIFDEIARMKKEDRRDPSELVDLGIGNPDQRPDPRILEILSRQMNSTDFQNHRYSPFDGAPELRSAIAGWYQRRFGATVDPGDEVLPLIGSKEGIAHLLMAYIDPGDTVVIATPCYPAYLGAAGVAETNTVELALRAENDFLPDFSDIHPEVWDRAKFLFLNYPNNPTGAVLSAESMERIVAAADRVGAWILADEIYRGAELDGVETPTFWGRYDKVLITSGMSKAYGLPGLRIGWAVVPEDLRESLWARKDYTSIAMGSLSDRLATEALRPDARERIWARTRGILTNNWPVLEDWMRSRGDTFTWQPPRAGAIVYARYDLPIGGLELAERMRLEADCLIVPGEHFDMPNYVRLGFGPRTERLREALSRCGRVLDSLRSMA